MENGVTIDPKVCHGRPVIAGTRILVADLLALLEAGVSVSEMTSKKYFPQLSPAHVRAALHFAAEQLRHREFIAFSKS